MMDSVLTLLLAGGKGTRLEPLTRERAKPAVPFGGMYRIIDFALSNCLNSRQMRILVLTQYKSLSLEAHVSRGWGRFFHPEFGQWLAIGSPQQRVSEDWYLGTANAVFQNIYSIEKSGAEYVLVLAADHVYKMDYRPMLEFHRDSSGAVTVGTLRVPVAEAAGQFGVVEVDRASLVVNFEEKPERPACLPGDQAHCLASMGIYVFTAAFLIDELRRSAAEADPSHDFGQHFLPKIIGREPVRAFTFSGRGTGAPAYWRDVGTVDAYFRANMDLLADSPDLDICTTRPGQSTASTPASHLPEWPSPPSHRASGLRGPGTTSSRTARSPMAGSGGRSSGSIAGSPRTRSWKTASCSMGPASAVGRRFVARSSTRGYRSVRGRGSALILMKTGGMASS